jgi:hypothetical protein
MKLKKITEKGKTGNFYVGQSEILIVSWNNGANPDFYAFDKTKNLRQVDKEYFALATTGVNYKTIEEQLPSSIESYSTTKDNNGNIYYCLYQDGIIYGFDKTGTKFTEWTAEVGEGHPIYDIKYQEPDYLWLAFPTGQTVAQVSISKQKETYKIGEYSWDDNSEPLSYPESIFIKEQTLYIPNMGNNKLFKFNIETKELILVNTFDEKIWQYEETDIGTFIVTDTGIYEIE